MAKGKDKSGHKDVNPMVEIHIDVVMGILKYLNSRPYGEVANAMPVLTRIVRDYNDKLEGQGS